MNTETLVVGVAGMPGSGKSLIVETAREADYNVVSMGDVVREETEKRGLEPNPRNTGLVMLALRKERGKGAIAERCIIKIERIENKKILVDGIRSLSEVEAFKERFQKFSLIAIHSSPETRFARIYRRGRSDDPTSWRLFRLRDMRELGVGLGGALAMAKYLLINEGNKKTLKNQVIEILRQVEKNG